MRHGFRRLFFRTGGGRPLDRSQGLPEGDWGSLPPLLLLLLRVISFFSLFLKGWTRWDIFCWFSHCRWPWWEEVEPHGRRDSRLRRETNRLFCPEVEDNNETLATAHRPRSIRSSRDSNDRRKEKKKATKMGGGVFFFKKKERKERRGRTVRSLVCRVAGAGWSAMSDHLEPNPVAFHYPLPA